MKTRKNNMYRDESVLFKLARSCNDPIKYYIHIYLSFLKWIIINNVARLALIINLESNDHNYLRFYIKIQLKSSITYRPILLNINQMGVISISQIVRPRSFYELQKDLLSNFPTKFAIRQNHFRFKALNGSFIYLYKYSYVVSLLEQISKQPNKSKIII